MKIFLFLVLIGTLFMEASAQTDFTGNMGTRNQEPACENDSRVYVKTSTATSKA